VAASQVVPLGQGGHVVGGGDGSVGFWHMPFTQVVPVGQTTPVAPQPV
jgi:hypothetical protein